MNSAQIIILSPLELRVIEETNKVRTQPMSYLTLLNNWKQRFSGNQVKLSQQVFLRTIEGVNAVDEAMNFRGTRSNFLNRYFYVPLKVSMRLMRRLIFSNPLVLYRR